MTHEQLRDALRDLEYINLAMHEQATRPMHTPSAVSVFKWSERLRAVREALAALERAGEGETYLQGCGDCDPCIGGRVDQCAVGAVEVLKEPATSPDPDDFGPPVCAHGVHYRDKCQKCSDHMSATPPAAERDVSGWAPELREVAASIPESGHDEVAREAAAEREGDDAAELKAWREMFAAFAASGLPASWPNPNPKLWPNQWPQDVAMVAFALHRAQAPADAQDAARYRWLRDSEADSGLCVVNIRWWSEEYDSQARCDLMDGPELDAAIDKQREGAAQVTPLDAETQRILAIYDEWLACKCGEYERWAEDGAGRCKHERALHYEAETACELIRSLSERLARVEEDAGRYLKLRDHLSVTQCAQALGKPHAMNPKDGWSREDWFDAVVDEAAAIRAGK